MSRCLPEEHRVANEVAAKLERCHHVVAADVLPPKTDPTDSWVVDVALRPGAGGLGGPALQEVEVHDVTVRHVGPQGDGWQALLVV